MAYTRSWNDATPAGTRAANQIDDAIREFKVDVHERMDDVVDDWTADPVVPKDSITGKVDGKYLLFPYTIVQPQDDQNDVVYNDGFFQNDATKSAHGSLIVPIGITIVEFSAAVDRNGSGTVTVEFYRELFSTGASTLITTVTRAVAGYGIAASGVLAEVTDSDRMYRFKMFSSSILGEKLYGIRLKYNTPDSRNTI